MVCRDRRDGVAEALADDVYRLAGEQQQQRGVRVPQVVQPDRRRLTAALDVAGELPGQEPQ